ncbi:lipopolysaccharide biosynthesis protein [Agromyces sp. NPDC058484]|uniref:lipopolysaccharide biosynthesis protein n=1 Tax=Agromyces sp. NPDC058484 TaxID=3346524 RepID=UPI003648842C
MKISSRLVPTRYTRGLAAGAWYSAAKIVPGVLMLLMVPLWIRLFGDAAYGLYSIAWTAAILSGSLCVGWLRQSLLRYAGDEARALESVPRFVLMLAIGASALPAVGLTLPQLFESRGNTNLQLSVIAVILFTISNSAYLIAQANLQREERARSYATFESLRVGVALVASLACSLLPSAPGDVVMLSSFVFSTLLVLGVLRTGRRHRRKPPQTLEVARSMWAYGWPMSIWLALSSALLFFDRLIIGFFLGTSDAGQYAAVSDLVVRGVGMVLFPITMIAHPRIMRAWNEGGSDAVGGALRSYTRAMAGTAVVVIIGAATGGTWIVELVLGFQVQDGALVPALAAGAALWQVALLAHKSLEIKNRTLVMAVILGAVTAVSIFANVILVPRIGMLAPPIVLIMSATMYIVAVRILGSRLAAAQSGGTR